MALYSFPSFSREEGRRRERTSKSRPTPFSLLSTLPFSPGEMHARKVVRHSISSLPPPVTLRDVLDPRLGLVKLGRVGSGSLLADDGEVLEVVGVFLQEANERGREAERKKRSRARQGGRRRESGERVSADATGKVGNRRRKTHPVLVGLAVDDVEVHAS